MGDRILRSSGNFTEGEEQSAKKQSVIVPLVPAIRAP